MKDSNSQTAWLENLVDRFSLRSLNNNNNNLNIMDSKTVLDVYKRYLHTLDGADAELFTNYGKIRDFIDSKCDNFGLWFALFSHCVRMNLKVIRERNIKIKSLCPEGWSSEVVQEGYRLLRNFKKAVKDDDLDSLKVNFYKFVKLAKAQNPHLQLYLYLCYDDRINNKLFKGTMEEIEEAAARAESEAETAPTD